MIINANVRYCNDTNNPVAFEVETHIHRHWELVYYYGNGISTVNNIPYTYGCGNYVLIPAEVPHSEKSESQRIICIGFDTDLPKETFHKCFFTDDTGDIGRIVSSIVTEIREEPPYYSLRINLLLRDLLLQTIRKAGARSDAQEEKLNMILNYLDAYCTTDVDFKALANSLNYSYDYLRHYFKQKKGMSLKQYVIRRRIRLAKEYLISNMPIAEVSGACGFSSPAHFAVTFRQITGITPSQFRESCKNIVTEGNDPIFQS